MSGYINKTDEEIEAKLSAMDTATDAKQPLTGNTFAVATLPPAAANVGRSVYCTDGAAGSPCLAISNGTNWLRVTLGAAVAIE